MEETNIFYNKMNTMFKKVSNLKGSYKEIVKFPLSCGLTYGILLDYKYLILNALSEGFEVHIVRDSALASIDLCEEISYTKGILIEVHADNIKLTSKNTVGFTADIKEDEIVSLIKSADELLTKYYDQEQDKLKQDTELLNNILKGLSC